jgi:dephospho-CoA kinase
MGSGKDTFASFIKDKNYKRFAMADPIKVIATEHFGWDGNKDDKGRKLLQILGTEAGRKYNNDIWIDKVVANLYNYFIIDNNDKAVITDCRFFNELEKLKTFSKNNNISSITIKITRPGFVDFTGHESEKNINKMDFDFEIINDGDIDDFKIKSLNIITV